MFSSDIYICDGRGAHSIVHNQSGDSIDSLCRGYTTTKSLELYLDARVDNAPHQSAKPSFNGFFPSI